MNFIKTVCLKGRRPSPDVVNIPFSSDQSRSPSPELSQKKIIVEVPDPKESGKYIRVKGEARRIKFLKDCDLQPVVDLGEPVPEDEDEVEDYILNDMVQHRLRQKKPKEAAPLPKPFKENRESVRKPSTNFQSEKKRAGIYQKKIDSLKMSEAALDDALDDSDDGDFRTLAELRESLKQEGERKSSAIPTKTPPVVPKAGARKNFPRPPVKPKAASSSSDTTNKSLTSEKDSNERVFVVMPDGSMVEVSTNKDSASKAPPLDTIQKKMAATEKTVKSLGTTPTTRRNNSPAGSLLSLSLEECTDDANEDSKTLKLPNTLQLVQSELPLTEAENNSKLIGMFLFRQVVSPNDPQQRCLLCTSPRSTFRELSDLEKHYTSVHELASQTFKAEFSENVVFVCVPPDVAEQTTLNSVCRFCDATLKNLAEVRSHYPTSHNKVVRLVQESQVTDLSTSLFCSICSEMSATFADHHKHMKAVHRMQTYACKFCGFITSRANRLKTHFKQKHASSAVTPNNSKQGSKIKLKCPVCQLFVNGKVNLDQHILLAHSVQTGPDVWSCAKCMKPCTTAKEFTVHVFSCSSSRVSDRISTYKPAFIKPTTCVFKCNQCAATFISEKLVKKHLTDVKHTQGFEIVRQKDVDNEEQTCFLCKKVYISIELYKKHLLHCHMTWVESKDLKREDLPTDGDVINSYYRMEDLPTQENLAALEFPTKVGHYCHVCDTVINSYALFYIHMQDLHSSEKCFKCVITACSKTFASPTAFIRHIAKHPQELTHICSICDSVFTSEAELKEHNLSVDHGNKYMKMHEKCRPSSIEARNYQCKVCRTWFGLREYLIQHMETDSHDYKCGKCGLQYLQPGSRRLHIQQVHPELATVCEFCGQKMASTQAVWGHLKTHGIVHECSSCHRRFLHKEQVTTHMETHDPPIVCPWPGCSRQLVTKISLYFHLKTHRGDEEHKCRFCQKGFSKPKLLEAHMKIHEIDSTQKEKTEKSDSSSDSKKAEGSADHDMIQLICAGCDKGFDDEDQFAGHDCKKDSEADPSTSKTQETEAQDTETKEDEKSEAVEEDKAEDEPTVAPSPPKVDSKREKTKKAETDEAAAEEEVDDPPAVAEEEKADDTSEERKGMIEDVLSLQNPEGGDFEDLSSDMVLELDKGEVMSLEGDADRPTEQTETSQEGTNAEKAEEHGEDRTVMMVVSDNQDDSSHHEMELELPDDAAYAGATLLKMPTTDGQVLLIPISSADGTMSLQLPPGLTLEGAEGPHGGPIRVALEGTEGIEENGETRFLVKGQAVEELMQVDEEAEDKMS